LKLETQSGPSMHTINSIRESKFFGTKKRRRKYSLCCVGKVCEFHRTDMSSIKSVEENVY
jgi:hypothetical protein